MAFLNDYSGFWKGLFNLFILESKKIGRYFGKEELKNNIKLCGNYNKFKEEYMDSNKFDYDNVDSPFRFFYNVLYNSEDKDEKYYGGKLGKTLNKQFEDKMYEGAYEGYKEFWIKNQNQLKQDEVYEEDIN